MNHHRIALVFMVLGCVFIPAADSLQAANERVVRIRVDRADCIPLEKDVFGINGNLTYCAARYDAPDFVKLFTRLGSPFVRFPGGSVANNYDWKTGRTKVNPKGSKLHNERVPNINFRLNRSDKPYDTETFLNCIKQSEAPFAMVINIGMETPSSTREWMTHIKHLGHSLERAELGNELYFPSFSKIFPDPMSYVIAGEEHAKAIRDVFPGCKIGLVVSSLPYARESYDEEPMEAVSKEEQRCRAWDEAVMKGDYNDAVIIHMYARTGIRGNLKLDHQDLDVREAYEYALSFDDLKFPEAIAQIKRCHPGKEIWVTEYNIKPVIINNKDPQTGRKFTLSSTYLGCLFTSGLLMKLFLTKEVKAANWHNVTSFIDRDGETCQPQEAFPFLAIFREAVMRCQNAAPVTIENETEEEDGHDDLRGVFFSGSVSGHVFVMNRRSTSFRLDSLSLDGKDADVLSMTSITPKSTDQQGLRSRVSCESAVKLTPSSAIIIKPFSLNRIDVGFR